MAVCRKLGRPQADGLMQDGIDLGRKKRLVHDGSGPELERFAFSQRIVFTGHHHDLGLWTDARQRAGVWS